jgi:LacI family transcriptional regulator
LNDKPGISLETRTAVLEAADDLGYRLPKRRPRRGSTQIRTITIVHYADNEAESLTHGLPPQYVAGIEEYLRPHNVRWTFVNNCREGDTRDAAFRLLEGVKSSSDGFILIAVPGRDTGLLQYALRENVPVVLISRNWPDLPVSTVGQDHRQQAMLALDHLIELGHRKIAFLASEPSRSYSWFKVRLACYRELMLSIGEWDEELVVSGADPRKAVKALLLHRPEVSAVFAINDGLAVQTMQGLHEMGVKIPHQVSVIGLDDSLPPVEGLPGLTTVAFPHRKAGYLAAQLLLDHIEDGERAHTKVVLQSWLVKRASCAGKLVGRVEGRCLEA